MADSYLYDDCAQKTIMLRILSGVLTKTESLREKENHNLKYLMKMFVFLHRRPDSWLPFSQPTYATEDDANRLVALARLFVHGIRSTDLSSRLGLFAPEHGITSRSMLDPPPRLFLLLMTYHYHSMIPDTLMTDAPTLSASKSKTPLRLL